MSHNTVRWALFSTRTYLCEKGTWGRKRARYFIICNARLKNSKISVGCSRVVWRFFLLLVSCVVKKKQELLAAPVVVAGKPSVGVQNIYISVLLVVDRAEGTSWTSAFHNSTYKSNNTNLFHLFKPVFPTQQQKAETEKKVCVRVGKYCVVWL